MATEILSINTKPAKKSVGDLKKEVKDLKSELLNLQEGTEEYTRVSRQLGDTQHELVVIQENLKYNTSDLGQALSSSTSILTAASASIGAMAGAMSLLGVDMGESQEKLNTFILTMMSVTSALSAIDTAKKAWKGLNNVLRDKLKFNNLFKASEESVKESIEKETLAEEANTQSKVKNKAATDKQTTSNIKEKLSKDAEASSTNKATLAQRLWNKVIAANPLMSLVTVIGLAITAISLFTSKAKKAREEQELLNDETKSFNQIMVDSQKSIGKEVAQFNILRISWNKLGEDLNKKKKFIDANKNSFKNLGLEIKNINDVEKAFSRQGTKDFINGMEKRAKAIAYQNQLISLYEQEIELTYQKQEKLSQMVPNSENFNKNAGKEANEIEKQIIEINKKIKSTKENILNTDMSILNTTTSTTTTIKKETQDLFALQRELNKQALIATGDTITAKESEIELLKIEQSKLKENTLEWQRYQTQILQLQKDIKDINNKIWEDAIKAEEQATEAQIKAAEEAMDEFYERVREKREQMFDVEALYAEFNETFNNDVTVMSFGLLDSFKSENERIKELYDEGIYDYETYLNKRSELAIAYQYKAKQINTKYEDIMSLSKNIANVFGAIADNLKEDSTEYKNLMAAQSIINTLAASVAAFSGITSSTGGWGIAAAIAEAATVIASGFATVREIYKVDTSGSTNSTSYTPTAISDLTNEVTNVRAINDVHIDEQQLASQRVYVVYGDIEEAQRNKRVIVQNSNW